MALDTWNVIIGSPTFQGEKHSDGRASDIDQVLAWSNGLGVYFSSRYLFGMI